MSLRGKFHAAFSLIAALAIGLAVYGVRALSGTGDLVGRLYDEPLMGVNYARAASASFNEARGLMDRAMLLGPGRPEAEIGSLRRTEADIAQNLGIVRERMRDQTIVQALDRARAAIDDWFASGMAILAPSGDGVTELPMPDAVSRSSDTATAALDDVVDLVAARGFAYRSRAEAEMHAASVTLAALACGIIVLSGVFALLFAHLLIGPVRAATRIAEGVADGSLAQVTAPRRRDEIGRLLTCLASMQASLRSRAAQALALLEDKDRDAEALRQINLRFDTALNNMTHGLLMCDAGARVVVVNRRFCEMFRIPPDQVDPNLSYRDLLALSVEAGAYPGRAVDDLLAEQSLAPGSRQRKTVTQTIAGDRTVAMSVEPMPEGGWIAACEDITERRQAEEQVSFLAHHDALTLLPNRVLFQQRLGQALTRAETGKGFALLSLDLDRFKSVNDTLGHPVGDRLLVSVATRLRGVVRDSDTVARMGGDEFAVLQLDAIAPAETIALAGRIIRALSEPYHLDGNRIVIGASVGIVLAPADGTHPATLLKNADLALYRAKQAGRGTHCLFEPAMDFAAQARHTLERDLRDALPSGELELHFQPQVCCRTRRVTGFEALLRWRHPTRGLLAAGEFIEVAEDIGAILPIGTWVLRQACADAASWPRQLKVAVNLSVLQFRGQDLVAIVAEALRESGLAAERLELEITESVLLQDDAATVSILHALRGLGARIVLDDFGTGYSSLSYLRSFPFHTIKIDRSFVTEMNERAECMVIVRAVTSLGRSLQIDTIAEGVETEAQFELLAAAGCTEVQGYLFGRPAPAAALRSLIDELSAPRRLELLALASD